MESLEAFAMENKFDECGFLTLMSEYFMQGKYFMKAFSGLCNLSYMKNTAS